MVLMQRLEMRQGQSLLMTPQLLQAIKLLQLSHPDLKAYVEAELERNPLLERLEPGAPGREAQDDGEADPEEREGDRGMGLDDVFPDEAFDGVPVGVPLARHRAAIDSGTVPLVPRAGDSGAGEGDRGGAATPAREPSLTEHLEVQLDLATRDRRRRLIGRHLIGAIDEAGYLAEPVGEVAGRLGVPVEEAEAVLALIHTFDPSGIGARHLAECLAIQLREKNRFDPAMAALVSRLDLVAKRDLAALRRLCGVDDEDLAEMLAEIRRLEPKPGRAFGAAPIETLVADVVVRPASDGSFIVELNPDTLPRVLVNRTYHARAAKTAKEDGDKAFLTECLQSASWLARSLDQRAKTILKVAVEIVRQQDGFFRRGVAHLRPLNLKTVADRIDMHESSVSRVTSNKAMATPRGTFEMKYFFTAAIAGAAGTDSHSSEAVRHRIRQLVDGEADDVLSDDALVRKLAAEGIDIARRTVAKYRESLRIPSSAARRRQKRGFKRAS